MWCVMHRHRVLRCSNQKVFCTPVSLSGALTRFCQFSLDLVDVPDTRVQHRQVPLPFGVARVLLR